jgi:hypothetical protein
MTEVQGPVEALGPEMEEAPPTAEEEELEAERERHRRRCE